MTPPATARSHRTGSGERRPVRHPRRVSGPVRPARAAAAIALPAPAVAPRLDRLIRGRAWIALLTLALLGMVAMQLLVLELNTGIGRTLERVARLQRQNAQLGIEDSTYSAQGRVAPLAAAAGMTLAPVGAIHFVAANPADVARAASALSTPIQSPEAGGTVEESSKAAGSPPSEVAGSSSSEAAGTPPSEAAGSPEAPRE